ncbi:MAG: peptide chain release factor N(5)-glutamine methyltransferase [Caulobacteraceae bacterium]|nr:peptide chain release factor N(5)-glutamine methyltransferase [Caulobacteraceae bacterium]
MGPPATEEPPAGRTLVSAWAAARRRLESAGIDGPVIDARLLLEAATGASRTDIIADPHRPLDDEQAARLDAYLDRRAAREPVSHILGRKGFWKIMLKVTPDVLAPRPDTEAILDAVLADIPDDRPVAILDLGVGSGALLLSLLAERPLARGLGVDVSEAALAVARENAANLGLAPRAALMRGDWTAGLAPASFDLVVANPPYIPTADIAGLAPEVARHEPRLALDGGEDGLDAYRRLAPEILRVLRPGGRFAVEIGLGQGPDVAALFAAAGAADIAARPDLTRRDRVVVGWRPA